ncbi:class I SAM-dependent methyltransferase [Cocleimonas sp. KMM 6892]|uniref:class I SAM-dependent methyltransferase n=1 Tax=unclassified Cocleimonas TaxID=2639732 RepID=UPI002DBBD34D|nr:MULTISPECIES: class I SAM-dependent methyltransferase [unclassified Cocleimonas]MEB8433989.1 class I SAM-dependent methyltransferase [Cocleimonas sp. KMM 6892]MEC4716800.1 class I SAM-dependent methyltransferase [Cocleimonas sp. KMM 6895]MEC4746045.1 class I SAM-dependent methyltransferase [Cocleimonas sp. KMM 6896]
MNKTIIAITADRGVPKIKLDRLSQQTSIPVLTKKISPDYLLHISTDQLELRKVPEVTKKKPDKALSISIDFAAGKTQHRRLHGGGKGQDIAKAVGLQKIQNPTVLDLTAGMGGDAFVLASLGADVTMLERNPVVHALLKDALDRAALVMDSELEEILARLALVNQGAMDYLESLNESELPDVIYFDPMFPSRNKTAQVKKEMQFFHDIVGDDQDSESVLMLALSKAEKRIVVKRPRLAEKLTESLEPAFQITGKSTRYDIYLPKK